MTLQDFLVEHAKFPFPLLAEGGSFDITDISHLDVGLLTQEWKTQEAVRDETLILRLCKTLEDIIGDTPLPDGTEDPLRSILGITFNSLAFSIEHEDLDWFTNESERQVRIPDSHSHLCNSWDRVRDC